ncbi:MAG: hypothetical protein PHH96_10810 [Smithellaceae bacterium]|nr:hypothetical protein [Smithellaceae bacterium]
MADNRRVRLFMLNPFQFIPREPIVLLLIKNMQWFVANFTEFSAPTRAAFDRLIIKYFADYKNFLTVVNLVPDTLEDLSKSFIVRVTAIH